MPNKNRFNYRNRGVGEANTKLVLASLKSGAKTMNELIIVTGLTRQTLIKKIESLSDDIVSTEERPKRYYLKGTELQTVIDEVKAKESERKPTTKLAATKQAIMDSNSVVFFPTATHNDLTIVHDNIMNADNPDPVQMGYVAAKSMKDLEVYEHKVKVMYDLIQFRKSLRELE